MARKKGSSANLSPEEQKKIPPAPQLRNLIKDPSTKKALALYLDCTVPAVNQYMDGAIVPSLEKLCKIAEYFSVSLDYLLGRTEIPSPNQDLQAACALTGLSETAVKTLLECKKNSQTLLQTINRLLEDEYQRTQCEDPDMVDPSALRYLSMYLFFNEAGVDGDFDFLPNGEVTPSGAENFVISVPMGTFCTEALFNLTKNGIKRLRNEVLADDVFGRIK